MVRNICYGKHLSENHVQNQRDFTMLSITKNFPLNTLWKDFHNVFNLLYICRRALIRAGKYELWNEFYKEATSSNYSHALATIADYFDVGSVNDEDDE